MCMLWLYIDPKWLKTLIKAFETDNEYQLPKVSFSPHKKIKSLAFQGSMFKGDMPYLIKDIGINAKEIPQTHKWFL